MKRTVSYLVAALLVCTVLALDARQGRLDPSSRPARRRRRRPVPDADDP